MTPHSPMHAADHHPLFTPRQEVHPHMHYAQVFLRGFVCGIVLVSLAWLFMHFAV